jgi:hypothetical protein
MVLKKYMLARWDTSSLCAKYLDKSRAKKAAEKAGFKLKQKHTIVPHMSSSTNHRLSSFDEQAWL